MSVPQSVAEILNHHLTFQLECIDRMYLNVYVPRLQCEGGIAQFFRGHRAHNLASSPLMAPWPKAFAAQLTGLPNHLSVGLRPFPMVRPMNSLLKNALARSLKPEGASSLAQP